MQVDMESGRHTDGCLASRSTVLRRDLEETVCINLKGSDKFSLATWHGRDAGQLKFTKQAVITALRPFSFVAVTAYQDGQST